MLKIFNTLTKQKEIFIPIVNNKIKIYVCGMTVYDLCHIGHGRTFVIFDTIIRYFKHQGYKVFYVRNITDIDDKIIEKSIRTGENIEQLTNFMIQEMHLDLDALNVLRPNCEPRVTNYIDVIIKFISLLIKKKHAYVTSEGNVMFSVKTAPNYGMLSRQKIAEISKITNNSVNMCNFKKNSIEDFVLWKHSKSGEPFWMSPWGTGRPGWHIECSAINHVLLGDNLDIHGGGLDLIFPHHENEIAQSICAYNAPYAKLWMHIGLLSLNYQKMSKSLNNFLTIRDTLKCYDSETIRFFLMSAHYRKELQYSNDALRSARASLERLYIALKDTNCVIKPNKEKYFISKFISKMNDDFNIPAAYSVLFDIAHKLNFSKIKRHSNTQKLAYTLKYLANILGLLYQKPETFLKNIVLKNHNNCNIEKIQRLIQFRKHARENKKWKTADDIRAQLANIGIKLEDDSTGNTKWYYDFTMMK